ncbi:MAG: hypothetical protein IPJ21_16270 [Sterolibacteriaceae bacterium]|nr:hypothetical protein [Sterolibacteriaceae bacterium]MBK9085326.1 hypothetical protein [Sterolibacteriaceae bacterium]
MKAVKSSIVEVTHQARHASVSKHVRPKLRFAFVAAPSLLAVALSAISTTAFAAPSIQATSGTFGHKASVTITGSGFGTKGTAAPVVWDDASGSKITDKWSGAWPNAGTSSYQTGYTTPIRGITLPHSNISKYISGAHGDAGGFDAGYNVIFWKTIPKPSAVYASWYQRTDDAWVFNLGNPADNNFKSFDYSAGSTPYDSNNWYLAFGPPRPTSRTSGAQWLFTDDGSSLSNPDVNGHNAWWEDAINPSSGVWTKMEVEVLVSSTSNGYLKVWQNGKVVLNYAGPTDKYPGSTRAIGIGGYARGYGNSNNRRYYADAYLDNSRARVVLANDATLSKATTIETQIPTSWSTGSIGLTVNLGKFSAGQTAYVFVVDPSGVASSTGYQVSIGGTGSPSAAPAPVPPPPTPSGLSVQGVN